MPSDQDRAARFCGVFGTLESDRQLVEPLWRDVSHLVVPHRSTEEDRQRGRDRSTRMYDNTAAIHADGLVSLLFGNLTSPALEWFILQPINPQASISRESQLWLELGQQMCLSVFRSPSSGFNSAVSEAYDDLVGFGTCSVLTSDEDQIRYNAMPLDEVYIAKNMHGRIDTMYRKKFWTADQAAERFGFANLSDGAKKDFESEGKYVKEREYLHAVVPRDDSDADMINISSRKPYASITIDREASHIVRESGFDSFPFAVARWKVPSGEVYGTSPAIKVLDEVRLLNGMKKTIIAAAEKSADPPLQVDDDSVLGKLRAMAGGITYKRPGTEIGQLPVGDPRITIEQVIDARNAIREAFFADIAQLPLQDRMTATEVIERRNDKLQVLSPFVSRIQEELLSPIIGRTLAIMIKKRALPAPPRELMQDGLRVEYVSPLAVSQRTSRVQAVQVWINSLLPLAQIDPGVVLSIDTEELPGYVADALNVPPQLVRDSEAVRRLKEAQAQAQQIQQAAATGGEIAEAAKTAAEADAIAGRIGA